MVIHKAELCYSPMILRFLRYLITTVFGDTSEILLWPPNGKVGVHHTPTTEQAGTWTHNVNELALVIVAHKSRTGSILLAVAHK